MIAVAYIPVLHQGYRRFLTHESVDRLLLLTPAIIPKSIDYLHKEIQALPVDLIKCALESWGVVSSVEVASIESLRGLGRPSHESMTNTSQPSDETAQTVLLPDEDISRVIAALYFPLAPIKYSPIFLRWDKHRTTTSTVTDTKAKVNMSNFEQQMFANAYFEAGKSSDWWRHVGAVVAKDGLPLFITHNTFQPHEQQQYVDGDARTLFHAGEFIEFTSALHAEAAIIAQAARAGVSLDGAEMYVTTFPCPPCAKLIAAAGITKLYFTEGYSLFDAQTILESAGVEIIQLQPTAEMIAQADNRSTVIQYPS